MKHKHNHPSRAAKRSLRKEPKRPPAATMNGLLKTAMVHHQAGQLCQAETLYRQILQDSPNHPEALHLLGVIECQTGKFAIALELIDKVIVLKPDFAEAYSNRGIALHRLQQYLKAVESFDRAIFLRPHYAEAYNNRGNALRGFGQYRRALESFDQAILLKPDYAEAYNNRGKALHELQQYQPAIESFDQAILLKPDYAEAHNNRGGALDGLKQYQSAIESFDRSILLKPDYASAHNNRGNALQRLQQYQAALLSFDQAILQQPDYATAYNGRGCALHELREYEQAIENFDQAILLSPNYAGAYGNRGNAFLGLQQYQQALDSYDESLLREPGSAEAYNARATALHGLQQYPAALESVGRALLLKPDYAEAYANRGIALYALRQYQHALESLDKALLLKPDYDYLPGTRLYLKQLLCDWENIEAQYRDLEAQIERNKKATPPFSILAVSGSAALQRTAAEIFVRDRFPPHYPATTIRRPCTRDRIRIGYFSSDFYSHATCYLMAELFERHDRSAFEVLGFSFGAGPKDEMTQRVATAMDRFLDVRSLSDGALAQFSRELEVDIAVDLKGFTEHHRTGIFAHRAAPIQVNYLGYPGTMSAPYIDYLIADHTLIPEASRRHYSEKIVYLPDSYQVNDSARLISTRPYTRAEEGLPEQGFVYCCFNNNFKITPATYDLWMRILGRVEGSVLWLLEGNPWVEDNLRREAAQRGVAPQRLIFARRLPLAEHLARHSLADLFLDNLPCSAHTTASDALWAGLPLLTCTGETFASRVAASLLRAIDLPELVTTTEPAYETLAVELALNAERRIEIRERLQRNRTTAPLFDTPRFVRHLEAAYSAMYERYQADLPLGHIHIARLP
jgi:protein O-GlcNAc transferase